MIVYMAAKSVVLSPEDCQAVGLGYLPISTTHSQLYSLSSQAPKAAGKPNTGMVIHFWYPDYSLIRMAFRFFWPKGSG